MVDMTSRSFILVAIDFSYMTSYRLSIVTFVLGLTVHTLKFFINSRTLTLIVQILISFTKISTQLLI